MIRILDRNFVPYISASEIQHRVKEIADKINVDFAGESPIFLGVLNGAFMFFSDLVKQITIPSQVAFIKISSYQGTQSSGKITAKVELTDDLTGKRIIVVEDIVDTGRSMEYLLSILAEKQVASVTIASLLQKPEALEVDGIPLDYVGFSIQNQFVIGYGLDYNGFGRNLPGIYVVKEI
ncbi:MAG: hypoxanthine phosphoribosyltransferase [Lunatimonas sp.]|uniref:hypoxanthine phosphoribosyltransferase n=1 Tax=Lunatimonas sp. TaxID=2060141 RepID=UPI00263B29A5|nr:hypoxanthine phosphoribosyltransferase [Lunatimonas sp.]MCC5938056.1 hypoxanthine phosphoribosyltransferase [Lunatimonas sp.]